jgi:hypothetical protein
MSNFHRLATPSYFIPGGGPLPSGYDYLNNPVSGGSGSGIAAPADTGAKVGGTYDGVYFVGEDNENVNAFNANRLGSALGTNTDYLDNILNGDIVTQFFDDTLAGHGGSNSHSINASVDGLWLSNNGGELTTNLFTVTDLSGDPIIRSGSIVHVTSVSGAAIGSGFSRANPVVLHFNTTIPNAIGFRVLYGIQSSYKRVPLDAYFRPTIYRTSKLRGIVAAVSDNSASTAGDFNTATFDGIIYDTLSVSDNGRFRVLPGSYTITSAATSWDTIVQLEGQDATVTLDAGRGGDLNITSQASIKGISLRTASTTSAIQLGEDFLYDGSGQSANFIEFGLLKFEAPGTKKLVVRGAIGTTNATLTGADAGILITNSGIITLSDLDFSSGAPTASGVTYEAALKVDSFNGRLRVENCRFDANTATSSALKLHSAFGDIKFTNCLFNCATAGSGFGITADTCSGIVFENCTISATAGQAAQLVNSGIVFINCRFTAGTNTGQTNPQLLCGEGYVGDGSHDPAPLVFIDCVAKFTQANVRATGAPTKPIIELGGHSGVSAAGVTRARGLRIFASSNSIGVHNFTTVVLHGDSTAGAVPNNYAGVSIDMKLNVPAATGTLGAYFGAFTDGKGMVVEAIGGSAATKMVVTDLALLNVGWPGSAIARSVAAFAFCDATRFTLDGTTAGAGSYSKALIDARETDFTDMRFFPTHGLFSSGTVAAVMRMVGSVHVRGMRYFHHGLSGVLAGPMFLYGTDCSIDDATILVNSALSSGYPIISFGGNSRCALRGSTLFTDSVAGGALIFGAGVKELTVTDTNVTWPNAIVNGTVMVNFVATNSTFVGNRFNSTSADAPTASYILTGTSIPVTITDLNVFAAGGESSPPTVY